MNAAEDQRNRAQLRGRVWRSHAALHAQRSVDGEGALLKAAAVTALAAETASCAAVATITAT